MAKYYSAYAECVCGHRRNRHKLIAKKGRLAMYEGYPRTYTYRCLRCKCKKFTPRYVGRNTYQGIPIIK